MVVDIKDAVSEEFSFKKEKLLKNMLKDFNGNDSNWHWSSLYG